MRKAAVIVLAVAFAPGCEFDPSGTLADSPDADPAPAADPAVGGVDGGVVYLAFPGESGRVVIMEDHAEAVAVGVARVEALLAR